MLKLSKLLGKSRECIYGVCTAEAFPLENVADPVFSTKMMGDGIALKLMGDTLCSPCTGEVILCPDTRHAVGIRTSGGAEILIHIGLDTVNLKGRGFQKVFTDQYVQSGQPLIRLDWSSLDDGLDLTTMLIVTNLHHYKLVNKKYGLVTTQDLLFELER